MATQICEAAGLEPGLNVAGLVESSSDSVVTIPLPQAFCTSSTYAAVITAVLGSPTPTQRQPPTMGELPGVPAKMRPELSL